MDVHAYAIMSNHFHLVIYSDPNEPRRWSDESVVDRWLAVCPPKDHNGKADPVKAEHLRRSWLANPDRLRHLRQKLGSVSVFMKLLKQPIARRANREDDCTGHFFEQRFYSGALLDEEAVLATMAYVDLNPIRARITQHLEGCRDTSIEHRMNHSEASLNAYLEPVISGTSSPAAIPITLEHYTALLRGTVESTSANSSGPFTAWHQRLAVVGHRQRAYGALESVMAWLTSRGLSLREQPFA